MSKWQYQTPGIPDQEFIRGQLPMTKEEVRAVTISKLRLTEDSVVYDLGAGSGSISMEAGLIAQQGRVYAVEKKEAGIKLIRSNITEFGLSNVEAILGEATTVIEDLPPADRVMIGGSGGELEQILTLVDQRLVPGGRVVINAITLDTLAQARSKLEELDYELEICNIAVTRTKAVADYQMLQGMNPVYIICGIKRGEEDGR
ncbi:MAG: precorrin-6Y C5,15-methyltransferase (decarboxylating) subunit CbiT [Bacillota bacterium]